MDLRRARALLAVVFAATVLIGLNATMLSVALPSAVDDLGATPLQGSWMLLSYLVVSGAGLVLSGQLADCLELAPVFRVGLGAFAVSGLALAVSGEPTLFIAARALQGAGAALLLSTAAAIITVSHPTARRRGAMGVYLAGFSIAQVSGPMIGGVVTSTVGWRWLFLIGFVIAVGALVLGWVPLARLPRRGFTGLRVDLAGNALIVVVTSVLLVAFAGVQQVGWTGRRTVVLLVVAAVAVPLFVAVEHRSRWPAIAVDLLRDRAFALANLAAFCLCMGRVVPAVVLSLWFQGYEGDDPVTAALKVTPLAAAVTVGTLAVGRVMAGRDDVVVSRVTAAGAVTGAALLLAALLRDGRRRRLPRGSGRPGPVRGCLPDRQLHDDPRDASPAPGGDRQRHPHDGAADRGVTGHRAAHLARHGPSPATGCRGLLRRARGPARRGRTRRRGGRARRRGLRPRGGERGRPPRGGGPAPSRHALWNVLTTN